MYSFSTSWNYWRAKSGQQIVDEVLEIGLDKIELNFSLPSHLFLQLKQIAEKGKIKVTSLHNFCPLPLLTKYHDMTPDMLSLCSRDKDERRCAVEHTKKTMDAARLVGAQAVVLHLGRVKMRDHSMHDLIALCDAGDGAGKKASRIREKFLSRRERKGRKYFEQVLRSCDELNQYGVQTGVKLGLETRYSLQEMPTLDEFETIFKTFRGGALYYWHDVGHAMAKDYLGLESHDGYLTRLGPYLLGWHLHDAVGCRDHKAPGCGTFDFKRLLPWLNEGTINVLEPHHPATLGEIKTGYEFLQREILSEQRAGTFAAV